ncbi:hypothetical protein PMAYCL1PPCAC_25925 [Pristionchus mayeri]|uniref:Uncharacterized protein n=1 Tax=Pristionchus mayeri TaxID=1317129 RepID=A0AAN5D447_9BILA|nr:hypothetical protein PMAYCL1PPCAC_25925 [Pristionchus mayeri]
MERTLPGEISSCSLEITKRKLEETERSGECNCKKLEELKIVAENRRLMERLDEAKGLIESMDGEQLELQQEVIKRIEESSKATRELDGVRGRLEEMERAGEFNETKIRELGAEAQPKAGFHIFKLY